MTIAAPGLIGAAAGLLVAELMHRSARRGVALGLIGLGVAALMPAAVNGVMRKVNGPNTVRGSRRRLRGIRSVGLSAAGYAGEDDSYGV